MERAAPASSRRQELALGALGHPTVFFPFAGHLLKLLLRRRHLDDDTWALNLLLPVDLLPHLVVLDEHRAFEIDLIVLSCDAQVLLVQAQDQLSLEVV